MRTITALQAAILERNLSIVDDVSQITPMIVDRSHYAELEKAGYLVLYPIEDRRVWLTTARGKTALMCYRAQLYLTIE